MNELVFFFKMYGTTGSITQNRSTDPNISTNTIENLKVVVNALLRFFNDFTVK